MLFLANPSVINYSDFFASYNYNVFVHAYNYSGGPWAAEGVVSPLYSCMHAQHIAVQCMDAWDAMVTR